MLDDRHPLFWMPPFQTGLVKRLEGNTTTEPVENTTMQPTGVPPHIYFAIEGRRRSDKLERLLLDVPKAVDRILMEKYEINGGAVTKADLEDVVSRITMQLQTNAERAICPRAGGAASPAGGDNDGAAVACGGLEAPIRSHRWKDGSVRRLKEGWKAAVNIQALRDMYRAHHLGNASGENGFGPLKHMTSYDFSVKSEWKRYNRAKHIIADFETIALDHAKKILSSKSETEHGQTLADALAVKSVGRGIWKLSDEKFGQCFKMGYDALITHYYEGLSKRKRPLDLKIGTLYNARCAKIKKQKE